MGVFRKIKNGFGRFVRRAFDSVMGSALSQELFSLEDGAPKEGAFYKSERLHELVLGAASDSCVLLKNEGVLPLKKDKPCAVFGRCQYDWFYVGYGSGGDVHAPYFVNLIDGIRNAAGRLYEPLASEYKTLCSSKQYAAQQGFWGHWPFSHPEIPIKAETIKEAAANAETAVVVIGRAAGEDRDNVLEKGSWFLTDAERSLLDAVTGSFARTVVVLNIGSIMDLSWIGEYGDKLGAVLIAWLGGQESGSGAAGVLYGDVNPSGRLPDAVARSIDDHLSSVCFGERDMTVYAEGIFIGYRYFERFAPERMLYPFGHGLSYTEFSYEPQGTVRTKTGVIASILVKNIGDLAGKTAVLLWCFPPRAGMEKPDRVLVGFKKTRELPPGGAQSVTITCDNKAFASFDETKQAFVLEPGEYAFEVEGINVGGFTLNGTETVEVCHSLKPSREELMARIEAHIPKPAVPPEGRPSFEDIINKKVSPEEFAASLTPEELEALTRGHGRLNSPLGPAGNAGVFGGITPSLRERGVPAVACCDGPAGLRMGAFCTLIPCGTALAATFDTELVEALHEALAKEMDFFHADVRLAPGMNLHRNPLCGRNFEYFSEDPLLTGLMAAACVCGIAAGGKAACPKHFACNNQEFKRNKNDSVVSERSLRELYLRGFEICVKESMPDLIMTSYNKVNGIYSHYNFDLVTTVLRDEWGFEGAVMTDWWMRPGRSPEYPKLRDDAYRVRSQVDVLMPGSRSHIAKKYRSDGTLLKTLGKEGGITRAELERSAANVLRVVAKLKG